MKNLCFLLTFILVAGGTGAGEMPSVASEPSLARSVVLSDSGSTATGLVASWQPSFGVHGLDLLNDHGADVVRLARGGGVAIEGSVSCPEVTECAGPNCTPTTSCTFTNTNMSSCVDSAGVGFLCPPNKTIRVRSCSCACTGPLCLAQCPSSQAQDWHCR